MSAVPTKYADLVFHVLAHVSPRAPLNASLYNPKYIEFCHSFLGDARERALGEDVRTLAQMLSNHEILARVQTLAWLFDSAEDAARFDECELAALNRKGTFRSDVHAHLCRAEHLAAVELLRCAVALEAEHHERLPVENRTSEAQLREELLSFHSVAPRLRETTVTCIRALGSRGRALSNSIFVGLPEPGSHAPGIEHAVLQAAHEATVQEVSRARWMPFLETEHAALALLQKRMLGHQKEAVHQRWLQSLNLSQFGGISGICVEHLSEEAARVVETLLHQSA